MLLTSRTTTQFAMWKLGSISAGGLNSTTGGYAMLPERIYRSGCSHVAGLTRPTRGLCTKAAPIIMALSPLQYLLF